MSVSCDRPFVLARSAFSPLAIHDEVCPSVLVPSGAMSFSSVSGTATEVLNSSLQLEASKRIAAESVPAGFTPCAQPEGKVLVVANMTNVKAIWDRSMYHLPGKAVGVYSNSIPSALKADTTVSVGEGFSSPQPVGWVAGPVNSIKESINHGFGSAAHAAQYNPKKR